MTAQQLAGLTAAEAEALFLSGLPGPAAELGLGSVLAAATLKLRASLPASLRENTDRLTERFYLDAPGWYHRPEDVPHLPAVASAVWDRQVIQVTYQRWKEPAEVTRRLEPHGLVLKAGTWYVVARCDGAMRTYRVDQIVAATPCGCGFTAEPGFELPGYWHSYLAEFHRQLYSGHAVIRLSGDGVRRRSTTSQPVLRPGQPATRGAAERPEEGVRNSDLPICAAESAALVLGRVIQNRKLCVYGVVPLGVARDKRVCWRPQRKRCSMKDPPASRNESSVRDTGREPEARGANDTPGHLPQTREYPVLVTSSEDQAICNQTPTPC